MRKKRILLLFIFMITFSMNVFAMEKVELNVDKETANHGDEVTVSINFSKEEEIAYAYTAKLSYDENVFETIRTENFEEQENWSDINYNSNNKKFALINASGESGKKLLQLKLKVKEDAKEGKTTISVGNVTSTDGERDILIDGNKIEIQIGNRSENTTPDELKNNSNEKISIKTEKQSGHYLAIIPIVLLILIAIFVAYRYTKKKRISKKQKTTITVICGIVVLVLVLFLIHRLRIARTDTNKDGQVDLQDASKIIDYLLEIENPDEKIDREQAKQLDTNLDGEISTADIGKVVEDAKNHANHSQEASAQPSESQSGNSSNHSGSEKESTKARITEAKVQNYYVEKGSKVEIQYQFESNNDVQPSGILVENVYYSITNRGDGTYLASIPVETSANYGEKKLKVAIAMFGNETVKLEETKEVSYYVLKDKPKIEKFDFKEFAKEQTLTLGFQNKDHVEIRDAEIIFTKEGAETKEIRKPFNTQIAEGSEIVETEIHLKEFENGIYKVKLSGTYDRDEIFNETNQSSLADLLEEKTIHVISDYSADINITQIAVKNKQVDITFTSNNIANLKVQKIIVNGKEIAVTHQGDNRYTASIPYEEEIHQTITIQAVIIEYDISIDLTQNNTFEIWKEKPTITDVSVEEKEDGLHVKYKLNDKAKIANNIKAVITKRDYQQEKNISYEEATQEEGAEVIFETITKAGTYTIQFFADYDRVDGKDHIGEKISEDINYEIEITAQITFNSLSNPYPTKKERITITYDITSNTEEAITALTLDGRDFEVMRGDRYSITLEAPEEKGEKIYEVTAICYGEKSVAVKNADAKIYVLKSKPEVTNYKLDRNAQKITFDFDQKDADDEDIQGNVVVYDETEKKLTQKLEMGTNTIDLSQNNYDEEKTYQLALEGTYNLDGDPTDTKNQHPLDDIFTHMFQLQIKSTVTFENITPRYPQKEEKVKIVIHVDSNTTIPLSQVSINGNFYDVTSVGSNLYEITYQAKDTAGIEELKINRLKYDDEEFELNPETIDQIDVLKEKPRVLEYYEIEQNYEKHSITVKFTLQDPDGAIEENGAYIILGNSKEKITPNQENTITFEGVAENQEHPLEIKVNYDLDSDSSNGVNHVENDTLLSSKVMLISPDVFAIREVQTQDVITGEESIYVKKAKEFKLSFKADTFQGKYYPESVIIGGNVYELQKEGDKYITKQPLKANETAGKQEIIIEEILLNNQQKLHSNITVEIEVLKDRLSVENFKVDTETGKVVLSYHMADPDDSFVSGKIVMTKKDKNEVSTMDISKEVSSYTLNIEEFKKYDIELKITYDLDTNKNDDINKNEESFGKQEVEWITDYDVQVSDLQVLSVQKETHVAKLQFRSTNRSDYKVKYVKVVGQDTEYGVGTVVEEENTYTFEYQIEEEKFNKKERTEIKLESVKLENLTTLPVDQIATIIFKTKPEVNRLSVETQNNETIKATFEIKDEDRTLEQIYVSLRDETGKEITEQTLEPNEREANFTGIAPGKYQVVLKGNYQILDGEEHTKEELKVSDEIVEIVPDTKIVSSKVAKRYPVKGEEIEIEYNITANIDLEPAKITLNNNKDYDLTKTKDGSYKILYTAPEVAGIVDLEVTHIYFGNQRVTLDPVYEDQIEVLKEVPTYTIKSKDLLEQQIVLFDIQVNDPDRAMISGRANVDTESKELKSNETTQISVKIEELDTLHNLIIEIDYDLDSDTIQEEIDQNESKISDQIPFSLMSDYGLEVSNLRIVKPNTEEKATYVEKGEALQLKFSSTNKANLIPKKLYWSDVKNPDLPAVAYDIQKVEGSSGNYYVNFTASRNAGMQEFEIKEILLSGEKTIEKEKIKFDQDETLKITVLKDIPTIDQYHMTPNENSVTVTFTMMDPDKALEEGGKIRFIQDSSNREIQSFSIVEGTNSHTFKDLTLGENYTLKIESKYSLSEDGQNEFHKIFKEDKILLAEKEEPNFKVKNLSITERVPVNGKVIITFENSLISYKDVDTITIDDTEYKNIQKDSNGVYKIELSPQNKGKNTIHIQNVKIEEKVFPIKRPLSYTYEYTIPKAKDVSDIIEEGGKATIKYKLEDPDQSIQSMTAYMKNSSGSIASTATIEKYTINDNTENLLEIPLLKLSTYSIELRANCDIGDGIIEEKSLFQRSIESPPQVAVIENSIDKEYVEKGEKVVLTFKINTNIDSDVKKIYINQDGYNVEKVTEIVDKKVKVVPDTYTVTLEAPKESGVYEQNVTSIQIGNSFIEADYGKEIENNKVCIKVLKDKPTLTQFIVNEQDRKVTFKINDKDGAIVKSQKSKLIVKKGEEEVGNVELTKGNGDYEMDLNKIGMTTITYPQPYNVSVISTYDLRPDAPKEEGIWTKIWNFITGKNEEKEMAMEDIPEEPKEDVRTEEIFNENIELTGSITYNLQFKDIKEFYLFTLKDYTDIVFECSTGTKYKVAKVLIDGVECPVEIDKELGNDTYRYKALYKPSSSAQTSITYGNLILENGAAIEYTESIPCWVQEEDPTFSITGFTEDTKERKVRFGYKFIDNDQKLASNLLFTLKNSQGEVLQTIEETEIDNIVEFDIPEPPTSVYELTVTADVHIIKGSYKETWTFYNDKHKSSVTTSILSSKISNIYPNKGETIEIIYKISSTRVVTVDREDHTNQDKAVSITKMLINDELYDVETLDERDYGSEAYRVYYTAKNENGLEDIRVSKILFSNGEEEEFIRKDQIDVLKEIPKVTNFRTQNNLEEEKVTFTFHLSDPDQIITDLSQDIYAEINGKRYSVNLGENTIVADIEELDQLLYFEIKANYDLDSNQLEVEGNNQNVYEDHTLFKKPFMLTGTYGIAFRDIQKFNSKGIETNYFEKNEEIQLIYQIDTTYEEIYPEAVTIDHQKYTPEKVENKESTYAISLKATDQAGENEFQFNSVTLNSGNEIQIADQKVTYEVLKDPVTIENFNYSIISEDEIIDLDMEIQDPDEASQELVIEIKDENDRIIKPSESNLKVGKNTLNFKQNSSDKYFVSIYSTYDRDLDKDNSANKITKERIHYEIITIQTRYIEMKDIIDIELYNYGADGSVQRVDSLSKDSLDVLDNCIVKVIMKDMKEFYSNIKSWEEEGNQLKLLLEYSDAMVFNGNEQLKPLEVTLNILTNEVEEYQYEKSFKSLVEEMKANPTGTFNLNKDYDLTEYATNQDDTSKSIIEFDFQGKINGNGHRIYNAYKPLFNTLTNATIENLIIDEPTPKLLSNTAILTKTANHTIIRNVHVERPLCNYTGTAGIFAEKLENHSSVENCSVTNLRGNFHFNAQQISSIAVFVNASTIKNCYIEGYMNGGWHFNGGIARRADKDSEICNNIFKVAYTPYWENSEGGNAGLVYEVKDALLQNNLCLIENGKAKTIYYTGTPDPKSKNNCQLEETTAPKNEETNGVRTISKKEITAEFLRTELGFSDNIWNLSDQTSFEHLPTLKGFSVSYSDEGEQPNNTEVYIPDYNRLQRLPEYDKTKEITYNNMYKLMPFYDAKELVKDGNKIPTGNPLTTKIIKSVVPFDKEGKMISILTTENYHQLDKIKIIFKDGTGIQYHVDFDDYYGNVASYMISDLKIGYNYNKYVIDTNSTIVKKLIEEASKYDFNNDLAPLTTAIKEDSRLYREHFNTVTKKRIPEFVVNTLVNLGYNLNFESDLLNKKISQELIGPNNPKLKRLLFAYNYFTKWYDLDMQGLNVADAIMFHGVDIFDNKMTLDNLSKNLIDGEYSKTNTIVNYYNSCISPYTRINNLGLFLDYFIKTTTTYSDGDVWFRKTFRGGIYETVDINRGEGVDYTIWDHVKKDGKVQRDILPLLTVPENSTFVISSPTQVYYGSLRVYMTNPKDPEQISAFRKEKLNLFLEQSKQFYRFACDYWGKDILNKYCDTEYDMRTTYTGRKNETVYNNPFTTEEDYHKYFIEAIERWAGTSGAAYANGNEVFWNVIKMLDSFRVATHETLHNQDDKIFMNGYGRRGGAEDYAAGFLQQYYRDGWVSPNIFDDVPDKDNTTQNLYRATVETDEKLKKYYKNYFRTNDFLDYIEAQAFFQLEDSEKAKLITQVFYPEVTDQEAGDDVVEYRLVTPERVKEMQLTDMKKLWENRIMLRPGVVETERHSPGADTDSIFNIHWYQPYANNDRPDGASFKYNAWQMAGEKGYKEGLVAYYSLSYIGQKQGNPKQKTTDSIAIKYITGKNSFKEYKLSRYDELSQYFKKTGNYINPKQLCEEYLIALKADANKNDRNLTQSTNLKRDTFKKIRELTKDFTIDPFSDMTDTSTIETDPVQVDNTKNDIDNK